MPPLWRVQELIKLSDQYPSGLEWIVNKACNKAGTQAGRMNKVTGFYMVCIDNTVYLAHRMVYFLRTETDPVEMDIMHELGNFDKDNRKKLVATQRFNKKRYGQPSEPRKERMLPSEPACF